MSSSIKNAKRHPGIIRASWLGAATAVALVAGSATMVMGAPRDGVEPRTPRTPIITTWVRIDRPHSGSHVSSGGVTSDAMRNRGSHPSPFLTFTPPSIVRIGHPNGWNGTSGGVTTDAMRNRGSHPDPRLSFTQPTLVRIDHPSGGSAPGGVQTDALRNASSRPSLVYGLGRDDAGGVRAGLGLSFRFR